uniref:Uncharacterized protein n=2 Tax=Bos TaxID=9903 RepID=A0A4W2BM50_BOBOX
MQWFTEFMELFLSVWKLIKTLIFILSASLRTTPRAWSQGVPTQSRVASQGLCHPGRGHLGAPVLRTCGLPVGDAVLGQHALQSLYLLGQGLMCLDREWRRVVRPLVGGRPWPGGRVCTSWQLSSVSNRRPLVPPSCCAASFGSDVFR